MNDVVSDLLWDEDPFDVEELVATSTPAPKRGPPAPSGSDHNTCRLRNSHNSNKDKAGKPRVNCPYGGCSAVLLAGNLTAHVQKTHFTRDCLKQLPGEEAILGKSFPILSRLINAGPSESVRLSRHNLRNQLIQSVKEEGMKESEKADAASFSLFMARVCLVVSRSLADASIKSKAEDIIEEAYCRANYLLSEHRVSIIDVLSKAVPACQEFPSNIVYSYVSNIVMETLDESIIMLYELLREKLAALPSVSAPTPMQAVSALEACALDYITGFQIKRLEGRRRISCDFTKTVSVQLEKGSDVVPAQVRAFTDAQNRGRLKKCGDPLRRFTTGVYNILNHCSNPKDLEYQSVIDKVNKHPMLPQLWANIFDGSALSQEEVKSIMDKLLKGFSITYINGFINRHRNITDEVRKDSGSLRSVISR